MVPAAARPQLGQRGRAAPLLWAAREHASDHMVLTAASRDTSWPREERTAGNGTERTGGPLGRSPAGRRAARGGGVTSRTPRCACGLGKERRVARKPRRGRPARPGALARWNAATSRLA
jgi:hypothetical protein